MRLRSWIIQRSRGMRTVFATIELVLIVVASVLMPNAAHAQLIVSAPVVEGINLSKDVWDRVVHNVEQFLLQAGTVGLVNMVQSYGQKLAANAAEYIVTGNWGQTPLIWDEPWGAYLENAAYGAAGEFLQTLGENINIKAQGVSLDIRFGDRRPEDAELRQVLESLGYDTEHDVGIFSQGPLTVALQFAPLKADTKDEQQQIVNAFKQINGVGEVTLTKVSRGDGLEGNFGVDLCAPEAPDLLYAIPASIFSQMEVGGAIGKSLPKIPNVSLPGGFGSGGSAPLQPRCDFKAVYNNWEQWAEDQIGPDSFFAQYKSIFDLNSNDLAIANQATLQTWLTSIASQKEAELDRSAQSSYRDVRDKVSGKVLTNKDQVKDAAQLSGPKAAQEAQNGVTNALIASGQGAIAAIASTFVSTLASKIMDKYFTSGAVPIAQQESGGSSPFTNQFSVGSSSAAAFKAVYADVYTPKLKQVNAYDILTEFSACPDKFPQQNNCTIDEGLTAAVRSADAGKPLTVRDAISQDLLHGSWYLVPPEDAKNTQRNCWSEAYCYSNLAKLRRARIIPIGWELAAKEAKGQPVTLKDAMDRFNDCMYSDEYPGGIADAQHPFCHLVDPNWILLVPQMQCRAKSYSSMIQSSEAATRQEVCTDDVSCVATDENGKCIGAWGYCTREKNTWRFSGKSCPSYFDSCATLKERNGTSVSYLTSTVDSKYCSEKNVGCRGYYLDKTTAGGWDTNGTQLFLNQYAQSCTKQAAGCTQLQDADAQNVYYRIAPKSLGCVGDPAKDNPACSQYASVCHEDEVGCSLYTPRNGDPAVPAIATANDQCTAECVGYNQFVQQPTALEPGGQVDYFIPSTAQVCTAAEVGCSAFTNLDAQSGEQVAYLNSIRTCIKPSEAPNDTFYTWEGSDTAGYQLKAYRLKIDDSPLKGASAESGAITPAYRIPYTTFENKVALGAMYDNCQEPVYLARNAANDPNATPEQLGLAQKYNPDCREFYDANGKRSYRLLSQLVFASDSCALIRRNDQVSQDVCESTGGAVSQGNACVYHALIAESGQCSAAAVGCRAYSGSDASAGTFIYQDQFEDTTVGDWKNASLSTESVVVGGHSLKLEGEAADSPTFTVQSGNSYTLMFWARATSPFSFRVGFGDNVTPSAFTGDNTSLANVTIPADGVWRPYTFGPIAVPVGETLMTLRIVQQQNGGAVFIDNFSVKEARGMFYLVKDTWKTPASCDPNPYDKLPGPALGCRAYTDENKTPQYLTSFGKICRQEAVGCREFVNTQNSQSPSEQSFNGPGATGIDADGTNHTEDDITVPTDEVVRVVARKEFSCVEQDMGCTEVGSKQTNGEIKTDYFKNQPDQYNTQLCRAYENGCDAYTTTDATYYFKNPLGNTCTYLPKVLFNGAEVSGWFKTATTKSGSPEPCDPSLVSIIDGSYGIWKNGDAKYSGSVGVCTPTNDRCTAFIDRADVSDRYPAGKPYYFLDNNAVDTASCKGQVSLANGCVLFDKTTDPSKKWSSAATQSAALGKPDGTVAPSAGKDVPDKITATYNAQELVCTTDILDGICPKVLNPDCAKQGGLGGVGQPPAIPGQGGDKPKCDTFVDDQFCGAKQAACTIAWAEKTMMVDILVKGSFSGKGSEETAQATKTFPVACIAGLNKSVDGFCTDEIANSPGNAMLSQACHNYLTLAQVNDPYAAIYRDWLTNLQIKSRQACGANDSNVVIKVQRDRQCSEWLQCKTSFTIWDEKTGQGRDVCVQVGTCSEWKGDGKTGECTKWVSTNDATDTVLNKQLYSARDTSWFGADYSGYSIPNAYQIADLRPVVTDTKTNEVVLAYQNNATSCTGNKTACSYAEDIPGGGQQTVYGECINKKCVASPTLAYTIDASNTKQAALLSRICKAYPEQDSPFPTSIVSQFNPYGDALAKVTSHQNANTCTRVDANGAPQQCGGCIYQKVYYGQSKVLPHYYDLNANVPFGVCVGGFTGDSASKDGKTCTSNADCSDERNLDLESAQNGTCQYIKGAQNVYGTEGYCLEEDQSLSINGIQTQHPCLTWYPVSLLSGGTDMYNQYASAGYQAPINSGKYYCTQARGNGVLRGASSLNTTDAILEDMGEHSCLKGCIEFDQLVNKDSYQEAHDTCMQKVNPNELVPWREVCRDAHMADAKKYRYEFLNYYYDKEVNGGQVQWDSQPYKLVVGVGYDDIAADLDGNPKDYHDFYLNTDHDDSDGATSDMVTGVVPPGNPGNVPNTPIPYYENYNLKDIALADIERIGIYILPDYNDSPLAKDWMKPGDELVIYPDQHIGGRRSAFGEGYCATNLQGCTYVSGPTVYQDPTKDVTYLKLFWQEANKYPINPGNPSDIEQNLQTLTMDSLAGDCKGQNEFYFVTTFDNKTGKLTEVQAKTCDRAGAGIVQFALIFYLREYCTQVTQVAGDSNKAWTDRLYSKNNFVLDQTYIGVKQQQAKIYGPQYKYTQSYAPFGSANASADPHEQKNVPWYVATDAVGYKKSFVNAGSPLSCERTDESGAHSCATASTTRCVGGKNHGAFCNNQAGCPTADVTLPDGSIYKDYGVCMGVPRLAQTFIEDQVGNKSNVNDPYTLLNQPYGVSPDQATALLSEMFARTYGQWGWAYDSKELKYTYQADAGKNTDSSFTLVKNATPEEELHPPRVYQVLCTGGSCTKGKIGITVNDTADGYIISTGAAFTQTRFYAEASPNQMPIKRIAMDWGDGELVQTFEGKYKNRLPTCDNTNFGNSPDACTVGYYQFVHYYNFEDCKNPQTVTADMLGLASDLKQAGWKVGDRYCEFHPKVQILDNWDWCNASGAALSNGLTKDSCVGKSSTSVGCSDSAPDRKVDKGVCALNDLISDGTVSQEGAMVFVRENK